MESGTRVSRLDELIYEFAGGSEILTEKDVKDAVEKARIPVESLKDVIDTLCEITFLGLEVGPGRFAYFYDEDSTTKINVLARKTAAGHYSGTYRYRINKAFHAYLEIHPSSGPSSSQMTIDLPESAGNA